MRTCLAVAVLVLVACGNKKEEPAKTDPPPPKEAPKETPKEMPKAPPPPADAPAIDCAAVLTAAEIEKACGAKLVVAVEDPQIKVKQERCRISVKETGKRGPNVMVQVFDYGDPAAAEGMVKLETIDETKPLDGIGDRGWTTVKEHPKLKTTMISAGAQKGRLLVKAQGDKSSLNPKPACTIDQMVEVVKLVVAKLP